jgi:hypothetical protein
MFQRWSRLGFDWLGLADWPKGCYWPLALPVRETHRATEEECRSPVAVMSTGAVGGGSRPVGRANPQGDEVRYEA